MYKAEIVKKDFDDFLTKKKKKIICSILSK